MDKTSLRTIFLEKRMTMTQGEVADKNALITRNTVEFLKTWKSLTLHTFLPQQHKKEIDTFRIISALRVHVDPLTIVVPRIIPGTRQLHHFILLPDTTLTENKWGIPEPVPSTSQEVSAEIVDVVLVPLLAFDRSGYRVGYGGGYYDRFLALCRTDTLKLGLSFFEPTDDISDTDPFDIPLDYCITPLGIHRFI
ncbi:hypothetical protein DYBT9275_04971 [Dyadobacter sp. CECT 9275]|uniref:5-formyltetrahydrofolate cyclo-ligase n=1 Tax=Dyadobacter helix TaxID=2822344 RepID=A0A916JG39_9BACT|nr:5-formyltetrahydrofolate cyclo-ligase [Dyadobacter sp. CECT 9275]CAG5011544.1 hypothetical protein DYBT9275_04971 [Dyadobacter sp. CECT 9275]